jgi:SnoaL-like polyketide cyclase
MIRSMPTISERNKERVQFFVDAVWNEGRLELIDDLVATDYMEHLSCLNTAVLGPDGVRKLVSSRRSIQPDLYIKIDDEIAEHDLVAVRWRATECSGISVVRLLAGKLVDSYTTVWPTPTASGVAA